MNKSVDEINNQYHEELLKNQEPESIVENVSNQDEVSFSQEVIEKTETNHSLSEDLKGFGVDTNEPDLFNSENKDSSEDFLGSGDDDHEDDLEIPAFLRRQKN